MPVLLPSALGFILGDLAGDRIYQAVDLLLSVLKRFARPTQRSDVSHRGAVAVEQLAIYQILISFRLVDANINLIVCVAQIIGT